ncbi:DNA binding domain-containing protein, excisionase family [Chitinophaga rupis]|uniref:DNA binding domain-containing protein, excisionase family n=1 Tax=Chitinophaga rupis TaxID=573321 RepID=A0A1H8C998_9BACT|nr:helix-turn-helix domain-containing protein [Chitinophaga rupis]SEM90818.1 DNA binding domain-containing protein, excisionase family [Chitinophaga rupis]
MSPDLDKRLSRLEADVSEIKVTVTKLLELCATAFTDREIETVIGVKEVADMLNVDINVIYAKCANGEIPFQRQGRNYKFRKSEIVSWWNNRQKGSEFSVDSYVANYLQKHQIRG